MPSRPISFLSDFGHDDEFVGVVHGVVARIAPEVRVIDLNHGVPRGNTLAGALSLLRAIQYVPNGVVLAVVDPGVGSDRRAVAVETEWGHFVGPDNGLLAPAVAMVGGTHHAVSLEAPEFRLPAAGSTFDGRDVFAPAAAVLASGEATLGDLGPDIDPATLVPTLLPLVESKDGTVEGEVWWVDGFGNAETNVTPEDLAAIGVGPGDDVVLRVAQDRHTVRWGSGYQGTGPLIHTDAHGMIAVVVPGGRADESLGLHPGLSVGLSSSSAPGS
jgi:S-adenosylmethionine hydrolase